MEVTTRFRHVLMIRGANLLSVHSEDFPLLYAGACPVCMGDRTVRGGSLSAKCRDCGARFIVRIHDERQPKVPKDQPPDYFGGALFKNGSCP